MSAAPTPPPLHGEALLEAVTASMVSFHKRYYRQPVQARSRLLGDDLIACVLGGVYTDVEKTLIELQRTTIVNEARSAFQDAMGSRLIASVETLTGRKVTLFFSKSHIGPDLEIEIFLLGAPLTDKRDPPLT